MRALLLLFIVFFAYPLFAEEDLFIIIDKEASLSRFRHFPDNHLPISGSAQPMAQGIKELACNASLPLIVIDLREESHGFINDLPVSWTTGNYTWPTNLDEKLLLNKARKCNHLFIYKMNKETQHLFPYLQLHPYCCTTEEELAHTHGASYIRLPVPDHDRPSDAIVDQFIELYTQYKNTHQLHLHCRGGKGRTTTFFIIVDMLENAKILTFNEIMEREQTLASINLMEAVTLSSKRYIDGFNRRLAFLKEFYDYCKTDRLITWQDYTNVN